MLVFILPSHSVERKKANKTTVNAKAEKAGEETMAMTGLNQGTPTIPHIFFPCLLSPPYFANAIVNVAFFCRMNYCLNEPWHFDTQASQLHSSKIHNFEVR